MSQYAIDTILWSTGAAFYVFGGLAAFLWVLDQMITYIVRQMGGYRILLEAAVDIYRRRKSKETP